MDLSDIYPQSNYNSCKYSHNGRYIASLMKHNLVLRDAQSLDIIQLFSCLDEISTIIWSPDSSYILCGT